MQAKRCYLWAFLLLYTYISYCNAKNVTSYFSLYVYDVQEWATACFINKVFHFRTKYTRKWPEPIDDVILLLHSCFSHPDVSVSQHEGTREFKYSSLLLRGPRCRAAINLMACFIKSFPWIFNLHSLSEGKPQQLLYFSFPVLFI